ncbi:hypothetical protein CK203_061857 [Vitis vinifera]|uniref:Uncharacterized protein n=1 Tax=Vitis vinifera TaxID=29760 RepID=A0A438GBZ8_VITVI|nr:hypothetical protein CK203_061857 [Vitis vinifera]
MDIPDDTTSHNHHNQLDWHSCWGRQNNIQRTPTVEPFVRRRVLQLLGVGSSLPFCQRTNGKTGEDTDNCVCLGGTHCNHHFPLWVA